MELNQDFSRTLSLLRRERGVSQRVAAGELGISQALLSHYENGAREPGLAFVRKACDYYHVSADFLLGRSMSRDGTNIIEPEELYDASAEKGNVVRGSISAMLSKKLLVNSLDLLFDLLGKVGSKNAITARCQACSASFSFLPWPDRWVCRKMFFSLSISRIKSSCFFSRSSMLLSAI